MPDWNSLPFEIRSMILESLTRHKNNIAPFATVSREWQIVVEKKIFAHLELHPSCLDPLQTLAKQRKRLIKQIWLNIELERYTCRSCQKMESVTRSFANDKIIVAAITKLFSILVGWRKRDGEDLTLEINTYSPSDSEHWFKNCFFGAPGEDKQLEILESECEPPATIHDPSHGWWQGRMVEAPGDDALRRPFEPARTKFEEELPSVRAVTRFVLRRQCRRQINPSTVSYIWSKLPRLQEIVYEPWQLGERIAQDHWDSAYVKMISKELPASVKTVTMFEDFNENYLHLFQLLRGPNSYLNPERARTPSLALEAAVASMSRQLETLSVAFIADAYWFFYFCRPHWQWENLRSLTLTSWVLEKSNAPGVNSLLEDTARFALSIPTLETMTLWNGAKGEACAFIWCRQDASIIWRGIWDLELEYSTLKAWKAVAFKYARYELQVKKEVFDHKIGCHGDAIHHLGLHSVVDGVSLRQIRMENWCFELGQP